MIGSVKARRVVGLLVLLMAAVLVLSAALSPEADAKKKKKKKINVVQCPGIGACVGTERRDRLVGTNVAEAIDGGEGNDIYQANGGDDNLLESSVTSSDLYTGYSGEFGFDEIFEEGGNADFLDLSSLRLFDEVTVVREDDPDPDPDDLVLDGPGANNVFIDDHFGQGRIEKIKFANATVTGTQTQSLAREATEEEQAEIEERAAQDEKQAAETPEKE